MGSAILTASSLSPDLKDSEKSQTVKSLLSQALPMPAVCAQHELDTPSAIYSF